MNPSSILLCSSILLLVPACGREGNSVGKGGGGSVPEEASFARWVPLGKDEGRFETAIARFEDAKGRVVDLIGAVHIGERAYYEELNRRFRGYEVLLYELVSATGRIPDPKLRSGNLLSMLQTFLGEVLDLSFQLDVIDYGAENFVHADLDPKALASRMSALGPRDFLKVFFRSLAVGVKARKHAREDQVLVFQAMFSLFGRSRARQLRLLLGKQLLRFDEMLYAQGGKNGRDWPLIGSRNAAAFEVLDTELAKGRRKLGIFYGVAHLPDMSTRLEKRGFRFLASDWVTAWECRIPPGERVRIEEAERVREARRKRILERRRKRKGV